MYFSSFHSVFIWKNIASQIFEKTKTILIYAEAGRNFLEAERIFNPRFVVNNPQSSVTVSRECNVSTTTVNMILHELNEEERDTRMQFCEVLSEGWVTNK